MEDMSHNNIGGVLIAVGLCALAGFVAFNVAKMNSKKEKREKKGSSTSPKKSSSVSKPKAAAKSSIASIKTVSDDEDDVLMKGYKQLSNGKKTTFFNRELSEADKALLAQSNTGPQKISSSDGIHSGNNSPQLIHAKNGSDSKTSAWNSAGTFEEKDMTKWATDTIKQSLIDIRILDIEGCIEGPKLNVIVKSIDGICSYVYSRGKHKFIYDYTVSLSFTLHLTKNRTSGTQTGSTAIISGDLHVADITANLDYDIGLSGVSTTGSVNMQEKSALLGSASARNSKKHSVIYVIGSTLDKFLSTFKEKVGVE